MPAARARLANRERSVEEPDQLKVCPLLVERAAPGDIAGVDRLDLGQQPAAGLRAGAVGADQQVHLDLAPSGEPRHDPPVHLLEPDQGRAGMVVLVRKGRPECPEDRVPGGELPRERDRHPVAAFGQEVPPVRGRDDRQLRSVVLPMQQVHEVVLDRDTGPTAGHRARRALVHVHVDAHAAQHDACAQTGDGAADHGNLEAWTKRRHA